MPTPSLSVRITKWSCNSKEGPISLSWDGTELNLFIDTGGKSWFGTIQDSKPRNYILDNSAPHDLYPVPTLSVNAGSSVAIMRQGGKMSWSACWKGVEWVLEGSLVTTRYSQIVLHERQRPAVKICHWNRQVPQLSSPNGIIVSTAGAKTTRSLAIFVRVTTIRTTTNSVGQKHLIIHSFSL